MVDPAAAIEVGAALHPEPEIPVTTAQGKRYFGDGPGLVTEDRFLAGWVASAAGGLGVVLLLTAFVLWRGRAR
jgi:hypothetical protein